VGGAICTSVTLPRHSGERSSRCSKARNRSTRPFRIIEPVDAHDQLAAFQALLEVQHMLAAFVALRLFGDLVGEHADPVDARAQAAPEGFRVAVGRHAAARVAHHVVVKGELVGGGLEAEQVIAAQRLRQLFMRRDIEQDLRRGKRDMQEKPDAVRDAFGAQRFGERDQMIVVDPDDVVGLEQLDEAMREPCVDAPIAGVFVAFVLSEVVAVVEDRPQRRVREAAVILVVVLARESDGGEGHGALLLERRSGIGDGFADDVAAPAEPHAARILQCTEYADGEPPCRSFGFRRGCHTIRYDDQPAHVCCPLWFRGRSRARAPPWIAARNDSSTGQDDDQLQASREAGLMRASCWPQTGFQAHLGQASRSRPLADVEPRVTRYSPPRQGNALPSPNEIAVLAL
jgi:hypothetical protein